MMLQKKYAILFFFIVKSLGLFSQNLTSVVDPRLQDHLKTNYPRVWDFSEDKLNIDSAANASIIKGICDFGGLELTSANELGYFVNCDTLILSNNNLTSFDSIYHFNNIHTVDLGNNSIENVAPFFEIPGLKTLILRENKIIDASPLGISAGSVVEVDLALNQIEQIPAWILDSQLEDIDLRHNWFSFQDFMPFTDTLNYGSKVEIAPQRQHRFEKLNNKVNEGENVILKVPVDDTVTTNTYTWTFNGDFFKTTKVNFIEIDNVLSADTGEYRMSFVNSLPELNGFTFESFKGIVGVLPDCQLDITPIISDESCDEFKLSLDIKSDVSGFELSLLSNESDTIDFNFIPLTLKYGGYDLIITNSNLCEYTFDAFIDTKNSENCDLVITPNNDGDHDFIYFKGNGELKIFDQAGAELISLDLPANWSGQNKLGEKLSAGYYLIAYPDGKEDYISILY